MISPEQQQLDDALATAGHSEACSAYEMGHACSGPPVCHGEPVDGVPSGASPLLLERHPQAQRARPAPAAPAITLTGAAASAFDSYRLAARELRAAEQAHRAAQERYQKAHQAFADAAADS